MSYATELAAFSRKPISLVIITADKCANTYGVSPCTASGPDNLKCYNTFVTCQDQENYNKTSRDYKFCDADVVSPFNLVRPYVTRIDYIPTELREDKTLPQRVTIEFLDDNFDSDIDCDPYWSDRDHSTVNSVPGSFWKRWLARNPNYKGRLLTIKEGFQGLAENDYVTVFTGKIETIERSNNRVKIKTVDLLKSLDDIKYPVKSNVVNESTIGKEFSAMSQDEMLALPARHLDVCMRGDFADFGMANIVLDAGSSSLDNTMYYIYLVAYNVNDIPYARLFAALVPDGVDDVIKVTWNDEADADYYKIFIKDVFGSAWFLCDTISTGVETYTINAMPATEEERPEFAQRRFVLNGDIASEISHWDDLTHSNPTITMSGTGAEFSSGGGYFKVDKEVIYYAGKSFSVLNGIKRGQFNTTPARHEPGTAISPLIQLGPDNPFTHLKYLLDDLGLIPSANIDSTTIDAYETAWSDINFSTPVIVKDSTLGAIVYDLINALDARIWVNEEAKITIRLNSDTPSSSLSITDAENIIAGSPQVDMNEKSRFTRMVMYWNRIDMEKGLKEPDAYNKVRLSVDATAESANEYNDIVIKEMFTTWINDDCGTEEEISDYLNAILLQKLTRQRDAAPLLIVELELKDSGLKVGEFAEVSTDEFNNIDGTPYVDELFEVVKKEKISMGKFRFTLQKWNS